MFSGNSHRIQSYIYILDNVTHYYRYQIKREIEFKSKCRSQVMVQLSDIGHSIHVENVGSACLRVGGCWRGDGKRFLFVGQSSV